MLVMNLGLAALGVAARLVSDRRSDPGLSADVPAHRADLRRSGRARLARIRPLPTPAATLAAGRHADPRPGLGCVAHSRCTVRPGSWFRSCSRSSTPGSTTRPAVCCSASSCMRASRRPRTTAADRRLAHGRRGPAGQLRRGGRRSHPGHPRSSRIPSDPNADTVPERTTSLGMKPNGTTQRSEPQRPWMMPGSSQFSEVVGSREHVCVQDSQHLVGFLE